MQLVANRQRLKLPVSEGKPVALTDESRTIGSYGVKEGSQLQVKDLGRQIEYRVLYLWEYVRSPLSALPGDPECSPLRCHLVSPWADEPRPDQSSLTRSLCSSRSSSGANTTCPPSKCT